MNQEGRKGGKEARCCLAVPAWRTGLSLWNCDRNSFLLPRWRAESVLTLSCLPALKARPRFRLRYGLILFLSSGMTDRLAGRDQLLKTGRLPDGVPDRVEFE